MKKTGWGVTWPWDRKHLRELDAQRAAELEEEFARLDARASSATSGGLPGLPWPPKSPESTTKPDQVANLEKRAVSEEHDITMPKLGETVTEGTVSSWLKQVGDTVAFADPLLKVSTDKVDTEILSPYDDGVVLEILVPSGEAVPAGTPLMRIGVLRSVPSGDDGGGTTVGGPDDSREGRAGHEPGDPREVDLRERSSARGPVTLVGEAVVAGWDDSLEGIKSVPVSGLHRIVTIHPRSHNEAKTIGESFREGTPVIMNLTDMDDSDATRLVDFAAGLVFGHGTIERVTNKVFFLSPANVIVTAEDKARNGFFNQN